MKKSKIFLSFVVVFALIFSFVGQSMAADIVSVQQTEDGRIQLVFEFEDAEEAKWAAEFIGKMKSKNILSGYPDGTFRPNQPVKRAEAIVTAVRLMGLGEEAEAKASSDLELHFKDAKKIEKKYRWAKGYILVALENGLFDTSANKLQPGKPASRVWVSSLLVRALGLEEEALSHMTTTLDFKDANEIPAGSIGYIHVAVEEGLVSGYPNNTFKPNKNVTRAEMAALLGQTNEALLDNSGAVTVRGTITEIRFDSNNTVTEDVYGNPIPDGWITVETFQNDTFTYTISSELLVQFHEYFIRADQLIAGDVVTLVVQDNEVIEATLLDKEATEDNLGIIEFKVKVALGDDEEYELSYKNEDGEISGEIEKKIDGEKQKVKGTEAAKAVQEIMNQLALSSDMSEEEIIQAVLTGLEIPRDELKELEIELKFSNGVKFEIELENEDMPNQGYQGIAAFKLKAETDADGELELKYKHKKGEVEAEIEMKTDGGKVKYKGDEASAKIETLLDQFALSEDMDKEQVLARIVSVMEMDQSQLKKLELEIKFSNGKEIELETENEFEKKNDEDDEEDDDEKEEDDE